MDQPIPALLLVVKGLLLSVADWLLHELLLFVVNVKIFVKAYFHEYSTCRFVHKNVHEIFLILSFICLYCRTCFSRKT